MRRDPKKWEMNGVRSVEKSESWSPKIKIQQNLVIQPKT